MMGAVDSTYPLFPIACTIAAVLLLVTFLSSFVHQSWNLGVTFLCFWLFLENLTYAVDAIIWSDNADIKLYVYCDIVSHLKLIAFVVKPMSTLLITRRLYLITSLQSLELPSQSARQWDRLIEWTLGLIIPVLVAGPLYYTTQTARFVVQEGFGCTTAAYTSILALIIPYSSAILPPLLSVALYHTRLARILCRRRSPKHRFLGEDVPLSRPVYLRILAIATVDVVLSLSVNLACFTMNLAAYLGAGEPTFYQGWRKVHNGDWGPISTTWKELMSLGALHTAYVYYTFWTSPIMSFAIFGCFGLTSRARTSYWRAFSTVVGWFGWKPTRPQGYGASRSVLSSFRTKPNQKLQGLSFASESKAPSSVLGIVQQPWVVDADSEDSISDAKAVAEICDSESSTHHPVDETEDIKHDSSDLCII